MGFELPVISDYRRRKMMRYMHRLLEAQQALAEQGGLQAFLLRLGLHAPDRFITDTHYPKGDRIDFEGGSQYFYHCHREDFETEEHGHFHCFIRKAGWPKRWKLADISAREQYSDNPMTHLAAIGINRVGLPIRLFMVNRWVTKESWFEADKMQRLLPRFSAENITNARPKTGNQSESWRLVDGWVEALLKVYAPQIAWLYTQRDAAMAQHTKRAASGENPYENRAIEELASIDISLESQVGWLMQP